MNISFIVQLFIMLGISMLFIIGLYFIAVLTDVIERKLIVRKAIKNNWIADGCCWHTETSGVISNVGYSGICQMIATYTYKVGKNTYEHKKKIYPDKEGKINYNREVKVYYDAKNPDKSVVI